MKISKHAAQQIRAGITYAYQVINKERTFNNAPDHDDYSLFARAFRHIMYKAARQRWTDKRKRSKEQDNG